MRNFGRPRQGTAFTSISQPALGGTAYSTGVIYADITAKGEEAMVWLGIKESEWTVNDISIVKKEIEKEVISFWDKVLQRQNSGSN